MNLDDIFSKVWDEAGKRTLRIAIVMWGILFGGSFLLSLHKFTSVWQVMLALLSLAFIGALVMFVICVASFVFAPVVIWVGMFVRDLLNRLLPVKEWPRPTKQEKSEDLLVQPNAAHC